MWRDAVFSMEARGSLESLLYSSTATSLTKIHLIQKNPPSSQNSTSFTKIQLICKNPTHSTKNQTHSQKSTILAKIQLIHKNPTHSQKSNSLEKIQRPPILASLDKISKDLHRAASQDIAGNIQTCVLDIGLVLMQKHS